MARQDIQRLVTDQVIAALEKGGLEAWRRPWALTGASGRVMPYNWSTGNNYQGINTWLLMFELGEKQYRRNAWLTYLQAEALGGQVRRGETGTMVTKFLQFQPKGAEGQPAPVADAGESQRFIPVLKRYWVFNVEQVDGLDLPALDACPPLSDNQQLAAIELLANRQVLETGLRYRRAGDSACYSRVLDELLMPQGEFETWDHYAATLAHELVHATGHKKRLDRISTLVAKYEDRDDRYAFEELVAEMGACMVCAEHRITGQHLQHEAYIEHWLRALKADKTAIFAAAKLAGEAHQYLMGIAQKVEVEEAA